LPEPKPLPVIKAVKVKYQIGESFYIKDDKKTEIDSAPMIIEDRTHLPARYVTEPFGGEVLWDGDDRKVTCMLGENTVEMWIGKPSARVNGKSKQIDEENDKITPVIIDGRTLVPLRFLLESLNCEVEWVNESREIILTYTKE
jgi:hypothetical protein